MNKFLGWLLAPALFTLMVPAHAVVVDLPRDGWTATALTGVTANAFDGSLSTRWTTGEPQNIRNSKGYFVIDAGKLVTFDTIKLNAGPDIFDYPRIFGVTVSDDGINWRTALYRGEGSGAVTNINFPKQTARFIRIMQRGNSPTYWWSIAEVNLGLNVTAGVVDPKSWTYVFASTDQSNVYLPLNGNGCWNNIGDYKRAPDYYSVSREEPFAVDSIEILAGGSWGAIGGYVVEVNDNTHHGVWRTVATGKTGTNRTTINFPAQIVSGIRIREAQTRASFLPWTLCGLKVQLTENGNGSSSAGVLSTKGWSLSSSNNKSDLGFAIDGDPKTRWTTYQKQQPGQYVTIDMRGLKTFGEINLDNVASPYDYARGYKLFVSNDGVNFGRPIAESDVHTRPGRPIRFSPVEARYIRIEQTGSDPFYWWSIHEIIVKGAED
jgi:endo-1,3(4)-beta-glucanase